MTWRLIVESMIKQLPPSASTLRLLDLSGAVGDDLRARRADLVVTAGAPADENAFDAVVGCDAALDDDLLRDALRALRPGGRLIAVDTQGEPSAALVRRLEAAGYTRILVEELSEASLGVLMRGEKPHVTGDTLARIAGVAARDGERSALSYGEFKGHFVHLLIRQTPNKPVWALRSGETVTWRAVALADSDPAEAGTLLLAAPALLAAPTLLAFSSLPSAVAFMQPAVISGAIKDVNKVAKFSRAAAQNWLLLVNPALELLQERQIVLVPVDPSLAETADE